MAETYGKRQRDSSDGEAEYGRPTKQAYRVEEFLESMDPSVRIKLRSMFDDGLLKIDDLDERNITELSKFDAAVALEILEHYCAGDLSQVRNRRAYLAGAIKRRLHLAKPHHDEQPATPGLAPEVQRKLSSIKQETPKAGELDDRCMDTLASLPPSRALMALNRYSAVNFDEVRNPSALFMTMVRKVMAPAHGSGDWDGGYGSGSSYRDGGYHDGPHRGPHAPDHDYGRSQPQPPPPPPRRAAQQGPGVFVAGAGPAALGAAVAQQVAGGGLMLSAAPTVLGGLPPGLQTLGGSTAGATAAPGLVLAAAPGTGPGGVTQYVVVNSSSAQGSVPGAQVMAGPGGMLLAAPQGAAVQGFGQPAAAAVPPGVPVEWAAGRKNHGVEQGQLGVRVGEFHELSGFAVFVHPSPALKLQQLWDNGNELVSMLDDKVWQVLAEMPAPEALAAIQEAADALENPESQIRNINAFFMSVVKRVWPQLHLQQQQKQGGGYPGPGRGDYTHDAHRGGRGGFHGSRGSGDWGADARGYGNSSSHDSGPRPQRPRGPAIHLLPPGQRELAESLCRSHAPLLREEHFDEGVADSLSRLSHEEGLAVLRELGGNSLEGVRNLPAYIMGICKRYGTGQRPLIAR